MFLVPVMLLLGFGVTVGAGTASGRIYGGVVLLLPVAVWLGAARYRRAHHADVMISAPGSEPRWATVRKRLIEAARAARPDPE